MKSRATVIILTALITFAVTSIAWLGALGLVYWYFAGNRPPFSVIVDAPQEAARGETISMQVDVGNPSDEPLKLGSIDIYDSLLKGFTVLEVDPEPTDRSHTLNFSSFYFQKTIAPGKTVSIHFKLKADREGLWSGDVDCCTPAEKFVTSQVTIRVKPGGAKKESDEPPDVQGSSNE